MHAHELPVREVDMGRQFSSSGRALAARLAILAFLAIFWGAVAVRQWSLVLVIPAAGLVLVALRLVVGRARRR